MKDFDSWNRQKKYIDLRKENKFYHPRDIWWCSLGVNVGFEQDGSGKEYDRPVLVVKGFNRNVCLILPLTTTSKQHKFLIPVGLVDDKEAKAIISQVRLIDTKRMLNKIGVLNKKTFENIRKAVKDLF